MDLRCCYCGKTEAELRATEPHEDLRPYGQGGQPTCYECAMSTPERMAEATYQCATKIIGIWEKDDVVVIGDGLYGVQPLHKRDG